MSWLSYVKCRGLKRRDMVSERIDLSNRFEDDAIKSALFSKIRTVSKYKNTYL